MKRSPLKRKAPLKRTPLRRVSKKRAKENAEYLKARKEYMEFQIGCEMCGIKHATDIHHMMGRGKHLCDPTYFMAVCRNCHDYIEANKKWARENNYILYK